MKEFTICLVVGAVSFGAMGLQLGLFRPAAETSPTEQAAPQPETPAAVPTARFPDDLAPAAQAKPVARAAEFKPGPGPHKLVFLKVGGALHSWHDRADVEWQAASVEEAELAVVVGTQRKTFVNRIEYPNGAPPITRYLFELEVSVVEARTGKVLANRLFRNVPRPVMRREAWETTAIGQAVSLSQVFAWVSRSCAAGFPEQHDPTPITTQAD